MFKLILPVCLLLSIVIRGALSEECSMDVANLPCRNDTKACDFICKDNKCEIRALVILPDNSTFIANLKAVMQVLNKAAEHIKREILPDFIDIKWIEKDDKCNPSYAQMSVIDGYSSGECFHVILGPICDYCIATISRIVKFLGTPLITAGGFSQDFQKPKISCEDEYFMMIRSGVIFYEGIAQFIRSMAEKYNWKKLMFLYEKDDQYDVSGQFTCSLVMQSIANNLSKMAGFVYDDGDLGLSTLTVTDFLKTKIGTEFGIILMCNSPEKIREILLAAQSLGNMVDKGEYIFFNIELTNRSEYPDRPWISEENDNATTMRLESAYNSVLTITMDTENTAEGVRPKVNLTTGFYDGLLLYAHAINDLYIKDNISISDEIKINNFDILKNMWGKKFKGVSGDVEINCNGDRINYYSLLGINRDTKRFEKIASYKGNESDFTFEPGKKIFWPSGLDEPPPDVPTCGYDNSKCPDTSPSWYTYLIIILVLLVCFAFIAVVFTYRRYKLETGINSMSWKVSWEDIDQIRETGMRNIGSMHSLIKMGSQMSLMSDYSTADRQIFITNGMYKNIKVAIKKLPWISNKYELKRDQLVALKQIKDIQHDHLVKFFGACIDPPNCCILTDYCSKGSLQDLLENDQFSMDKMIKVSILQDIIRGMIYLHQSVIKSHGTLTSSNCVVDSRLVVKITDFGLHFLKQNDEYNPDSYDYCKRKLWTAPELLRIEIPPPEGTPKGDVYSFGIIMHEVIYRKGVFYLEEAKDVTEIIQLVRNGIQEWDVGIQPFRPTIEVGEFDRDFLDLVERSWAENENERPDFIELKNKIRKFNKSSDNGNILDNLLSRMEQYANNLEFLVEKRTEAYVEEKRKCEDLLYQLLPKPVASQLIAGNTVNAEFYKQVTIYFSDIVGFTSLSADSTPMQVVCLLNDLYTCFDKIIEHFDVYKVETIGDAYMVVSGLPVSNGMEHARQIARMALALLAKVHKFKIHHRPNDQLKLRIGLHTGSCVAGVVGVKMPRYCLFGDTVNTASRMESNGEALKIHCSSSTKEVLDTFKTFELECRGEIDVKGKKKMTTYWLNGERSPDGITNIMNGMSNITHLQYFDGQNIV